MPHYIVKRIETWIQKVEAENKKAAHEKVANGHGEIRKYAQFAGYRKSVVWEVEEAKMNNAFYVEEFKELARKQLRASYIQLTSENAELFDKMYGSVDDVSYDKMPWAYSQMRRALEKSAAVEEGA